jgi:hypothetical protein
VAKRQVKENGKDRPAITGTNILPIKRHQTASILSQRFSESEFTSMLADIEFLVTLCFAYP